MIFFHCLFFNFTIYQLHHHQQYQLSFSITLITLYYNYTIYKSFRIHLPINNKKAGKLRLFGFKLLLYCCFIVLILLITILDSIRFIDFQCYILSIILFRNLQKYTYLLITKKLMNLDFLIYCYCHAINLLYLLLLVTLLLTLFTSNVLIHKLHCL